MLRTQEGKNVVGLIMAFESGELGEEETIELFQHLIDSGLAWQLQGSYGRAAAALIERGACRPAGVRWKGEILGR